ncbi:MAG: phospho-sugar mutase [Myxococcota bacterium]|nr:phospho-sugar mutase [Myxococcota bacterium]
MTDFNTTALEWVATDPDPLTKQAGQALLDSGDSAIIADHFGRRLAFGTAGMRGPLGPGPNRMNRALVRRVAQALGAYLIDTVDGAKERPIVVGFDGRHGSRAFAADSAGILMNQGFTVYAFDAVCATPQLAHAITHLNAVAGIMVTASHNPPQDNGYKVYWGNGAQIIPPHDAGISAAIDAIDHCPEPGSDPPLPIPESVWSDYIDRVLSLRVRPATGVRAVYTAMHGVGWRPLKAILDAAGHTDVHPVAAQRDPDGDFPTVRFPNPEEDGALDLAIAHAQDLGAELIVANDPDADRLAVALQDADGRWVRLTGNQVGALLAEELLAHGPAHPQRMVATTIVSTILLKKIASRHGAICGETLTGFKWLANLALAHDGPFVLGFEEALGYSVGDVVRDKDGLSATLLLLDLASTLKARGLTLWDALARLDAAHGAHRSAQLAIKLDGEAGARAIEGVMRMLRTHPPSELAGSDVVYMRDLQSRIGIDCTTGASSEVMLPASNVMEFTLGDGTRVLARPSGTEPKIKFYVEAVGKTGAEADARTAEVIRAVRKYAKL